MTEPPKVPTRTTRIPGDLGEKLEDVLGVLGQSSAEYLDPLIRRQIESDYKTHSTAIEAKQRAEEEIRKAREKAAKRLEGVDLGEAGA